MTKGSKVVDGKSTKAEQLAWLRFSKQVVLSFVTVEERVEDAFRTAYRVARDTEIKKAEKKQERLAKR
jgi:hypothetical protein